MKVTYNAMDTDWVAAIRAGAVDDYGRAAEHAVSDGGGNPCRHCLADIPKGEGMLILSARPFQRLQPYAETGPVFLCAEDCRQFEGVGDPPLLAPRGRVLIKGYSAQDRIIEGSGAIVDAPNATPYCETLLERPEIAYIHVRSATNNCYLAAVRRKGEAHGTAARSDP